MTKKKKIKLIILLIISGIVLIYHVIWYINLKSYDKYTQANMFIHEDYRYSSYTDYETDRIYEVYTPRYPTFTGNISISPNNLYRDRPLGDVSVGITIYPKLFGGFEADVSVSTVTEAHYNEKYDSWNIENENRIYIRLDENMQPLDDNDEESLQAYEDNIEQIKQCYQMAHDMWGF